MRPRPAREDLDRRVVRARVPGVAPAGDPAAPTPVIGDLVRIAKTYNDGGIFGLFDAAAPVLGLAQRRDHRRHRVVRVAPRGRGRARS